MNIPSWTPKDFFAALDTILADPPGVTDAEREHAKNLARLGPDDLIHFPIEPVPTDLDAWIDEIFAEPSDPAPRADRPIDIAEILGTQGDTP